MDTSLRHTMLMDAADTEAIARWWLAENIEVDLSISCPDNGRRRITITGGAAEVARTLRHIVRQNKPI